MIASTSGEVALRCEALVKTYGAVKAVDGVDLSVRRGECFGLLGPNGAGKTTTIEILEGLTTPDSGEVRVLDQGWGPDDRALRERLGIQLQDTQLGDKQTVAEVVRLFRSFSRRGRDIDATIELLGLTHKRDARVGQLSGGQMQRLALAAALVTDPEILFLDEPTTGIDPQGRFALWDIVKDFLDGGGTVLLTTHYMDEAAKLCDRVGIMDHGKVIALDSPAGLIASLGVEQIVELVTQADLPMEAMKSLRGVSEARKPLDRYILHVTDIDHTLPALIDLLRAHEARIDSLITHQPTLDDVFVHLTGKGLRDD